MGISYQEFCKQNPYLYRVISEKAYDFMLASNDTTGEAMDDLWISNIRQNIKKFYKDSGAFVHDFGGFGFNKATIAVGAGPSLHCNLGVLKKIYDANLHFELKEQPFVIVSSNHQFKPLMKDGIHPHFVLLVDASDTVYDQLCKDSPKLNKWTILVASLQSHPKVLDAWKKLGGDICFFLPHNLKFLEEFKKLTNEDPEPISIPSGGNVMNTAWMLAINQMKSTVFMALGNDLSYPLAADYETRKTAFYADGDYQQNIDNKRDEAKDRFIWMGFKYLSPSDSRIQLAGSLPAINFELQCTSKLLGIYKNWIEMQVASWADRACFHYYNCSEQGILGVLAKDDSPEALGNTVNWYLMDALYPKRWHTRRLADAAKQFLEAKERWQGIHTSVNPAVVLPQQTDSARIVVPEGVWN